MNPRPHAARIPHHDRNLPSLLTAISFGVFCFVYPFAILLLSLDLMPFGMEWMSSLLLAMLGLSAWGWLWLNFGGVGAALGGLLFVLGVALEYVGVLAGVPFGHYTYTGVLIPELPGGVPLAIGFAWLMIVVSGLFTARLLLRISRPNSASAIVTTSMLGAALAVGLDLLLEPVAYHVKRYWLWEDTSGGYYGVPWSNFATWFVAALAMNMLVTLILRQCTVGARHASPWLVRPPKMARDHEQGEACPAPTDISLNPGSEYLPDIGLHWKWLPPTLYTMNVFMFGIVNVAHGFWASGAVALVLLLALRSFVALPGAKLMTEKAPERGERK
ncbi:MAG TPA: carotenoid biosynthesis protein [Chloroflexia bacterium]|jgi:putative membrane protein